MLDNAADWVLFKFWCLAAHVCRVVPFLGRHTDYSARQALRFLDRRLRR